MNSIGNYILPGVDICRGKFSTIQQCMKSNDRKTIYAFKVLANEDIKDELALFRFLNHLRKNKKIWRKRSFKDFRGNKVDFVMDFMEHASGVAFIMPYADSSLQKEIEKPSEYFFSEFEAITIFSQILTSYKSYYELKIPYKVLNPANLLKYHKDYLLSPPSTLMKYPDMLNPESTWNDYDYLYSSPEILKKFALENNAIKEEVENELGKDFMRLESDMNPLENENIITSLNYEKQFDVLLHKQDIWSMGVIMFQLIFGHFPFQHYDNLDFSRKKNSFIKSTWNEKKKIEEMTFRWYWYYQHIINTPIQFPTNISIHPDLIDLLKKMLNKDPLSRISFKEILNHPFMNYYAQLYRSKQEGTKYKITQIFFDKSFCLNEREARRSFKNEVNSQIKSELFKIKERRKTLKLKHQQAQIERKKVIEENKKIKKEQDKKRVEEANERKRINEQKKIDMKKKMNDQNNFYKIESTITPKLAPDGNIIFIVIIFFR